MSRHSKNFEYQTIEQNGVKLTVQFTVDGKYYPATHYEPAEYPELIIHEICVYDSDVNLYDLFTEDQIDEITLTVQSYLEY
jgi:hypothetical protein